jgi:hypothetical protein
MNLGLDHAINLYGRGPSCQPESKPRVYTDSHLYAKTQIASTIALGAKTARPR